MLRSESSTLFVHSSHAAYSFRSNAQRSREIFQYNRPQRSAALGLRHPRLERLKHYVSDLAKHVKLQLLGCVMPMRTGEEFS
jgi:hypothetical protein